MVFGDAPVLIARRLERMSGPERIPARFRCKCKPQRGWGDACCRQAYAATMYGRTRMF